jgi:hypothetical protein
MKKGMRFIKEKRKFKFRKKLEAEDEEMNESDEKRMSKICLDAMNSVNKDLQFTVETSEDFYDGWLARLDFKMKVVDGKILHTYYEKPMRNPMVLMERSAMSEHQIYSIMSNEIIRRLSNVSHGMSKEEKVQIVDKYARQLKNSGYTQGQAREAIVSGLKGFLKKWEKRKKAGENFY